MKSAIGDITFEHYTKNDQFLVVTATVYFDTYGEPSLDVVEIEDENGNNVDFLSLNLDERRKIEDYALDKTTPQDEVYDDYDDFFDCLD